VNALQAITRRIARSLVMHAAVVSPAERGEWVQAMINELEYLSPDMSVVGWALGCIFVCYSERMRAMIRPFESLPRWILVLEMLVCFLPLALLFLSVLQTGAHGGFYPQSFLLYCSGTVLGPIGLAVGFRSIFFKARRMSRASLVGLSLLAAWTLAAYSAQILTFGQSHLSDWWREIVIIAVLPTLAVLHLVSINSQERGSLVAASDPLG
jgi:hypothetical protein